MKTENDVTQKILNITTKIKNEHPELYPYLEEMAVTLPDSKNPSVDTKALEEYYNSLIELLKKYNIAHHEPV